MPLSDVAVRAIRPREKAYKVHDRNGLFLLVNPGGSKLWRWRYRFDQKEKLMALGEYPVVSLAQVRDHHLLDSFNTGHDGSLATIHANSATRALSRFANLVT